MANDKLSLEIDARGDKEAVSKVKKLEFQVRSLSKALQQQSNIAKAMGSSINKSFDTESGRVTRAISKLRKRGQGIEDSMGMNKDRQTLVAGQIAKINNVIAKRAIEVKKLNSALKEANARIRQYRGVAGKRAEAGLTHGLFQKAQAAGDLSKLKSAQAKSREFIKKYRAEMKGLKTEYKGHNAELKKTKILTDKITMAQAAFNQKLKQSRALRASQTSLSQSQNLGKLSISNRNVLDEGGNLLRQGTTRTARDAMGVSTTSQTRNLEREQKALRKIAILNQTAADRLKKRVVGYRKLEAILMKLAGLHSARASAEKLADQKSQQRSKKILALWGKRNARIQKNHILLRKIAAISPIAASRLAQRGADPVRSSLILNRITGLQRVQKHQQRINALSAKTNLHLRKSSHLARSFGAALAFPYRMYQRIMTAMLKIRIMMFNIRFLMTTFAGGFTISKVVGVWSEFSKSLGHIRALTGLVGKNLSYVQLELRKVAATTVFTAQEAVQAFIQLKRAGVGTLESLRLVRPSLQFAQVGEMGVDESTKFAATLMKGFGVSTKEVTGIMDVFTKATLHSLSTLKDLREGFKFVVPIARSLGIEVKEVAVLLAALGDIGILKGLGGRGLRAFFSKLLKPVKGASKEAEMFRKKQFKFFENIKKMGAIKALGILVRDLNDIQQVFGKFGTRSSVVALGLGQLLNTLEAVETPEGLKTTVNVLEKLKQLMDESPGVMEKYSESLTDTLHGSLLLLKSVVKEAVLYFGFGDKGFGGGAAEGLKKFVLTLAGAVSIYRGMGKSFKAANDFTPEQEKAMQRWAIKLVQIEVLIKKIALAFVDLGLLMVRIFTSPLITAFVSDLLKGAGMLFRGAEHLIKGTLKTGEGIIGTEKSKRKPQSTIETSSFFNENATRMPAAAGQTQTKIKTWTEKTFNQAGEIFSTAMKKITSSTVVDVAKKFFNFMTQGIQRLFQGAVKLHHIAFAFLDVLGLIGIAMAFMTTGPAGGAAATAGVIALRKVLTKELGKKLGKEIAKQGLGKATFTKFLNLLKKLAPKTGKGWGFHLFAKWFETKSLKAEEAQRKGEVAPKAKNLLLEEWKAAAELKKREIGILEHTIKEREAERTTGILDEKKIAPYLGGSLAGLAAGFGTGKHISADESLAGFSLADQFPQGHPQEGQSLAQLRHFQQASQAAASATGLLTDALVLSTQRSREGAHAWHTFGEDILKVIARVVFQAGITNWVGDLTATGMKALGTWAGGMAAGSGAGMGGGGGGGGTPTMAYNRGGGGIGGPKGFTGNFEESAGTGADSVALSSSFNEGMGTGGAT